MLIREKKLTDTVTIKLTLKIHEEVSIALTDFVRISSSIYPHLKESKGITISSKRKCQNVLHRVLQELVSQSSPFTRFRRQTCLVSILEGAKTISECASADQNVSLAYTMTLVLKHRLHTAGDASDWHDVDEALAALYGSGNLRIYPTSAVVSFVTHLVKIDRKGENSGKSDLLEVSTFGSIVSTTLLFH